MARLRTRLERSDEERKAALRNLDLRSLTDTMHQAGPRG
jgi:hypothetical protein